MRRAIEREVLERGFAHVASFLDPDDYRALAIDLGEIVCEERIAIRPGAHAYVAKPGPVPLHTDQPEVDIISWHCEEQDAVDGASVLFDMRPFIDGLGKDFQRTLREVELMTPPLTGGPATMKCPVLRASGSGDAIFCSPWLRSASLIPRHVEALEAFRERLSRAITESPIRIRLARGEALFIDNRRVLHGRDAISAASRRSLRRFWLRRRRKAMTG